VIIVPSKSTKAPDNSGSYQLSVDTGGTFTDGYVTGFGRSAQVKVDTTPADPTEGLVACVAAAADAMGESLDSFLARANLVHFSSTIATNIAIQRSGAAVGLIVTAGHQDLLYGSETEAHQLFGLVGRDLVQGVDEAVSVDGTVTRSVDPAGLEEAVRSLLEHGVHMVVVSFEGAHLNPANEVTAKALIEASYPRHYLGAVPLVLSSQISLHRNDYGRTALAVANAYLHPALARSLYRGEDRLREHRFQRPLLIVNTDGSSTRVAKTRAIDTFNSGPSAGVLGAANVARELGATHVVTFDVGGTTTDVAHIAAAEPILSPTTSVADVEVSHPSIALASFGLGGGSIIEVGADGALTVGPQSAGAVPGPACFGLGGTKLTPTDVWLVLGYLEPGKFLSGRRQLDASSAGTAIARLADELSLSPEEVALDALDAIQSSLASQMKSWATRQPGFASSDPAQRWLFSYGGGGGLLAVAAAESLGIEQVMVFPQSSVFSAFGGGLLPIAHSYHGSVRDVADGASVTKALTLLMDRALRDMRAEGVLIDQEMVASLTLRDFDDHVTSLVTSWVDVDQQRGTHLFTLDALNGPGELTLSIRSIVDKVPRVGHIPVDLQQFAPRRVIFRSGAEIIPVVGGLGVADAEAVEGPAFLAVTDTTIFIPHCWRVEFNALGYGIARRCD
jgi:N-methylhydantoinase A